MSTQVTWISSWNQYPRVLRPLADCSWKQQVTSLAELKYLKLPEAAMCASLSTKCLFTHQMMLAARASSATFRLVRHYVFCRGHCLHGIYGRKSFQKWHNIVRNDTSEITQQKNTPGLILKWVRSSLNSKFIVLIQQCC